jgi:hypothetical protein
MDNQDGNDNNQPNDSSRDADPLRDGDRLTESIRQRLEALVPEMVRKTFAAGMGAVFHTEDSIRKVAKEVNLPNVAGYIASSADATKDKVLDVIARETREFLEHMNIGEEVAKMLTTLSFEIKTEIRFIPNSERYGGAEPDVKSSVRLRRSTSNPGRAASQAEADKAVDADEPEEKERSSRLRFWKRDTEET